jgi:hypothetical protein
MTSQLSDANIPCLPEVRTVKRNEIKGFEFYGVAFSGVLHFTPGRVSFRESRKAIFVWFK